MRNPGRYSQTAFFFLLMTLSGGASAWLVQHGAGAHGHSAGIAGGISAPTPAGASPGNTSPAAATPVSALLAPPVRLSGRLFSPDHEVRGLVLDFLTSPGPRGAQRGEPGTGRFQLRGPQDAGSGRSGEFIWSHAEGPRSLSPGHSPASLLCLSVRRTPDRQVCYSVLVQQEDLYRLAPGAEASPPDVQNPLPNLHHPRFLFSPERLP